MVRTLGSGSKPSNVGNDSGGRYRTSTFVGKEPLKGTSYKMPTTNLQDEDKPSCDEDGSNYMFLGSSSVKSDINESNEGGHQVETPQSLNMQKSKISHSKKNKNKHITANMPTSIPNLIDKTAQFESFRLRFSDFRALSRDKVQRRFIKLVNMIVEQEVNRRESWINMFVPLTNNSLTLISEQKGWQNDRDVTHCTICFVKFSLIIRKHHCRLCGRIVCDDPYGERKSCSIVVPLNMILEKVRKLNFSPSVKLNYSKLLKDDNKSFRCCVDCKNALLHDWKSRNENMVSIQEFEIITSSRALFSLKHHILQLLQKYKVSMDSGFIEDSNKLRAKLTDHLKDFEHESSEFGKKFFEGKNDRLKVKDDFNHYESLVVNINRSALLFFQDSLQSYRDQSQVLKKQEEDSLKELNKPIEKMSMLTKKDIRELREELMVMKEQKFIIESTIQDYTKSRKFHDLNSLNENKDELSQIISSLEEKLGEFGF